MFSEMPPLQSPTGARLALRHATASVAPLGIVLVSHGLAEHSGRYGAFAGHLAAAGFHVYAHDHRGHGRTTAPDAPLGRFATRDGHRIAVEDMLAVRQMAAGRHPGLPVIQFGHSMGGLLALSFAEAHPGKIDALAVWNSNLAPGLAGRAAQAILRAERMLKGSDVPSALLPQLTFGAWAKTIPDRRTDFDWLSHDEAEVARYVADPLCGFDASVSLWRDIFAMTYEAASPTRIDRLPRALPVHLVGGDEDPATDFGRAVAWMARRLKKRGLADVTGVVYRGLRHETLLERQDLREGPLEDFCRWCQRVARQNR
ncbi:alpha/beta fold hydrolase [Rhizobium sp. GN54]|uniref:alpha/beta fold hydrolase n=1 Tax=Rhizobium sp. GN54 TaxID=2898150 RepID=UPI001E5C9702|nr:alpha/beta hydrolase [Rhizobium sp. GN54]MCD2181744.1 alpha/beta hydrolase [Rhizobium sp. GN54]